MTASLIHKLCPILSTVCASFNFLTSLFINNITQHHFSWSTKISLFRYPSLYCRVQKQVSPKNVSSPCSLSLWNHADQALLFFFLLHFIIPHFALQDMSSNCVQVYILQTDEKLCAIQKSHDNNYTTRVSLTPGCTAGLFTLDAQPTFKAKTLPNDIVQVSLSYAPTV